MSAASDKRSDVSGRPLCAPKRTPALRAGLVSSFSQPEGNVTGVSWFSVDLGAKHLELVRELVPAATLIAVIVNPRNREAVLYEQPLREAATRVPGLQMEILKASTAGEIDAAFETLVQHKACVPTATVFPSRLPPCGYARSSRRAVRGTAINSKATLCSRAERWYSVWGPLVRARTK
jgi:ABC transporter substrate binding protein